MGWAVSLPFDGNEVPVGERNDPTLPGEPKTKSAAAGWANRVTVRPVEVEPRYWKYTFPRDRSGLLLLLLQNVAGGYGALFLSRSYLSKIASTTAREIGTPIR